MNKIFKVIWSKARNCYVVVSELAKSHDDGHVRRSRSGCCRKAAVLAAWVLTMGVSGAALAADMPQTYTENLVTYTLVSSSQLTGIYYNNNQKKYAVVQYSDDTYKDKTKVTIEKGKTGAHSYSVNSSENSDSNYNNEGATGAQSLAAGVNALAAGTNSVAIGTGATAAGNGATVIGQYASASGQYATAFGGLKTRNSKNNKVIYYRNEANGDASVAFGEGTKANGEASLAFGRNTIAGVRGGGQQSVAFGESTKALGGRSLAFGENTMAEFNDSVAFGNASRALSTGSLAHGNRTNAVGQYSTSWGNNTVAAGENATVFGTDAMAGAIDENGAIIIIDNNNNPVKIDKNGYKAFIDTNGKTQSVTYPVTNGETHKYLVLTDANNKNTYICDYRGNIHQITYDSNTGKIWWERDATTSDIAQIDPGSNGYQIYGQKNATAFGNATRATAAESTAWGQESIASGEASTAFGIGSKAEGKNSLAALGGLSANENSIAIGQGTKANNDEEFVSAAIGQNAVASGKKSLALGFAGENAETSSTVASGENALALGTGAQALAKNSISIGAGNKVSGEGSGAIGDPTDITGTGSYELGNDNGTYTENAYTDTSFNANDSGIFGNENKVHGGTADPPLVNIRVVGNNNTVTASNALVLGNNSIVPATGGIAIGNSVKSGVGQYNNTNTFGSNTTAIGNESQAYHDNAVAIGTKSKATGTGSIAIGDEASTLSNQGEDNQPTNAIAIGTGAASKHNNSTAIGYGANVNDNAGDDNIAIGTQTGKVNTYNNPVTTGISGGSAGIAIGKYSSIVASQDTTETDGIAKNNIAIGTNTSITLGSNSIVMGNGAYSQASQGSSIALGNGANVASSTTSNGVAIGTNAQVASTNGGVAIGNGAKATNSNGGDGSPVAVGQSAEATGTQAVAIGYNAKASGNQVGQTVVGSTASATANYGTIIGYGATGTNTQANQTAIGHLATTNAAGGVALGANSNSDRPYDSTSATSPYIPTGASDEQTNRINATKATTGAVSVGYTDSSDSSKNVRRQIINVAAGKEDTDAVNVAQLKAVQSQSHDIAAEAVKVSAEGIIPTDGNYVGGTNADGNILANVTTNNGAKVYDLKLNKDVVLGEKEANKGGSITVNDVGEAVKIDGKTVSIVKVGKADAETGETNEQRQVVLGIGQDTGGYIALNDSTGKKHTYIYNAISDGNTYLDSDTSKQFNRLEYSDYLQDPEFIATLDDGMKYAGDDGQGETETAKKQVISKELNNQLNIIGGATAKDAQGKSLLTDSNIGVNNVDGKLKIQLVKDIDLTQDGSVKMGNTTINNGGVTITPTGVTEDKEKISLTDKGLSNGGNQITHVDSGLKDATGNTVDLATASGDVLNNAVNVGDLQNVQKVASAHTAVTVNGSMEAPDAGADGNLGSYTDKEKGNLLLAQKKDTTTGQITYDLKLNDNVILGKDGSDGKDGQEGTIGLTGKDGLPGADGKQGYSTTIIKTEKGQAGKDGKTGKENLGGTDITRIVYTDKDGSHPQTVATLSDGLKFMGNDGQEVSKKLNETLSIKGGLDKDAVASASTKNLGVRSNKAGDGLEIVMTDTPDFTKVTVGEGTDPNSKITIGKQTVTGTKPDGSKSETSQTGNYITGLDNKAWDKNNVVADRAATEGQLKDAINEISGKDKGGFGLADENGTTVKKDLGQTITVKGDTVYAAGGKTVVKDGNIKTAVNDDAIQISLNDQISIGQKGEKGEQGQPGTPGKDGKVTVETKGGTTVVIGHNGADGDDGKDGLFVTGKDGKDGKSGVSITGPDGVAGKDGVDGKVGIAGKDGKDAVSITGKDGIGHIGLTGQKGEDGKDGVFNDLSTTLGTATLDPAKNEQSKAKDKVDADDKASRIQYQTTVTDKDGKTKTVINHEVATMDDGQKYAGDFGDGASVKLNKTVTIKGKVKADAKEDDFVDGNIAVVANKKGEDGELLIKLNKDLTGLNSATYTTSTKNGDVTTTSTTVVDGTGLKIENGPSITNTGIDGGSKKITNVADGEISATSKDAVNGSQLNDVKNLAEQHTTVEAGPSGNVTVTPGTNADGSKKYTVDLAKDVTFGDAAQDDKTVAISGTNGTITAGTGENKVTVDGSKGQIVAGGDNGVKIGNIENGDSSLTIYDKDGNAKGTDKAGKYVTNLGNKTWKDDGSYVSGRAATEDQLHQVESNVNKQIADVNTKIDKVDKHHTEVTVNGGTVAPTTENTYSEGNLQIAQKTGDDGQKVYDLKLSDNLNIGGAGKDGKDGQNGHMGINGADGKSGIGIDGKDGISIKGKDGKDGVTIKGIDGKNGTEGHIGLTGSAGKDGQNASADIHVKNGQVGVDGTDGHGGKDGMDRVVYEDHNHVTHEVATMDDGMKYSGDSGNAAVKLNKNVQIYGGATEYADGNNIGVVASQDGDNAKLQVKLAKDLKGISSIEAKTITTGNTTMDNGGLTIKTGDSSHQDITIQQGAVNMGGNKIEGVAPGKVSQDSTDAVNGSQLWQRDQAINGLSGSVNKLGNRINRVGAGAAALAALHPLDFDPDDKWDFAAGYGNYRGANAAAVGAYYRPNEDTMFSVGGSFGGGENMVNAGVSIKLGQGNHVSTSRVAMAKEIKDLRQNVANLNAIVNRQSALIDKLTGTNAGMIKDKGNDLFPDVPANHWAYEYVTKLKHAGILTGYPDGNFDGDRMMTRYEFAAIVYRAIMAGAASNPALNQDGTLDKLANEFSSEMKYIRIDTIAKDKNGKPTIERVRVISDAK